jgi:hypothetical protein
LRLGELRLLSANLLVVLGGRPPDRAEAAASVAVADDLSEAVFLAGGPFL